jgi:hypothetical protein
MVLASNDFVPAQRCGTNTHVKTQRHVRRPDAYATTGYRLHYTASIVIKSVALCIICLAAVPGSKYTLYARLGRDNVVYSYR